MFNLLLSTNTLFLISLVSFFIIFTIRRLLIKKTLFIFLYHISLFFILFIGSIGGGSAQNDGYERLKQFITLEQNNELELAIEHPENYNSMLIIDIKEFKNSNNFKDYLQKKDIFIDRLEAIFLGWVFVFLTEISSIFIWIISYKK